MICLQFCPVSSFEQGEKFECLDTCLETFEDMSMAIIKFQIPAMHILEYVGNRYLNIRYSEPVYCILIPLLIIQ